MLQNDNGGSLAVIFVQDAIEGPLGVAANTTSANGTTIHGLYGTLTIGSDGTFSYVVNNANPAVQALGSGQSLVDDPFTYTATNGTTTATTTLTITVLGTDQAPTFDCDGFGPHVYGRAGHAQGVAVAVFGAAVADTIDAGQTIKGLTFTVGGLLDGANEAVVVDGNASSADNGNTGTTIGGNSLGYSVSVSGATATVNVDERERHFREPRRRT